MSPNRVSVAPMITLSRSSSSFLRARQRCSACAPRNVAPSRSRDIVAKIVSGRPITLSTISGITITLRDRPGGGGSARKREEEPRALLRSALDPDSPSMALNDGSCDVEPETGAALFIARAGLERLENTLHILRWNT